MRLIKAAATKASLVLSGVLLTASVATSQTMPTATTIAEQMGIAWNLGNTMEVPGDPTAWGNSLPTQKLIDSVKAAGFSTVRIPCAWDSYADQSTLEIDSDWIAQVRQVVDYCMNADLFVVLNSHWDDGWLEHNVEVDMQDEVNRKQGAYWHQIATAFQDYDHRLLFAGANEPAVQDPHGTSFGAERMEVLNSYLQTFIDTVRATGGNNASRTLIIQGPRTDIELTNEVMTTLPTDDATDRLMAEVHFYPYQFTLMEEDEDWGNVFYYWGEGNHSTTDTDHNPTWGEEAYVDSMFNFVKTQFVDNGIPVLLGEFGAAKRLTLTGENLERHLRSRCAYYEYVVSAALSRGIVPAAWDTGYKGNLTFTIIDRETGGVYDLDLLNAIRSGAGLPPLEGDTSSGGDSGPKAMKVLYSEKDSSRGQVELDVVESDFTQYDSIIVRAYVNGETDYDSAGVSKYGYLSLNLVTMSDDFTWREAQLGDVEMDSWANYGVAISSDPADTLESGVMVPANPSQVDFFALQAYSKGYRGTIYVDWIVFKSNSGESDTLYTFDAFVPNRSDGNVEEIKSIDVGDVESDQEWMTATTSIWDDQSSPVVTRALNTQKSIRASVSQGRIRATWFSGQSGRVEITLKNLLGQTLLTRSRNASKGMNTMEIPANYSGMVILQLRQGDRTFAHSMICH
ncbi:MAG: glycoside hydrolase family 5 protein [Chitinispirillaceae bacterium]